MNGSVLIVEEDRPIRHLLVKMLERQDLDVREAADGLEALDLIFAGRFTVVVMDLMLPRVSGYDILARCAALLPPPRPRFIVTTACDPEFRWPLDPNVVTAVVMKPFDVDLLREIIRETARNWRAGQQEYAGSDAVPSREVPSLDPHRTVT